MINAIFFTIGICALTALTASYMKEAEEFFRNEGENE